MLWFRRERVNSVLTKTRSPAPTFLRLRVEYLLAIIAPSFLLNGTAACHTISGPIYLY